MEVDDDTRKALKKSLEDSSKKITFDQFQKFMEEGGAPAPAAAPAAATSSRGRGSLVVDGEKLAGLEAELRQKIGDASPVLMSSFDQVFDGTGPEGITKAKFKAGLSRLRMKVDDASRRALKKSMENGSKVITFAEYREFVQGAGGAVESTECTKERAFELATKAVGAKSFRYIEEEVLQEYVFGHGVTVEHKFDHQKQNLAWAIGQHIHRDSLTKRSAQSESSGGAGGGGWLGDAPGLGGQSSSSSSGSSSLLGPGPGPSTSGSLLGPGPGMGGLGDAPTLGASKPGGGFSLGGDDEEDIFGDDFKAKKKEKKGKKSKKDKKDKKSKKNRQ
jgi:hypothetical protein